MPSKNFFVTSCGLVRVTMSERMQPVIMAVGTLTSGKTAICLLPRTSRMSGTRGTMA